MLGDPNRLKQLLVNILKLALEDFRFGQLSIAASYKTETSELLIQVEDTSDQLDMSNNPDLVDAFDAIAMPNSHSTDDKFSIAT